MLRTLPVQGLNVCKTTSNLLLGKTYLELVQTIYQQINNQSKLQNELLNKPFQ